TIWNEGRASKSTKTEEKEREHRREIDAAKENMYKEKYWGKSIQELDLSNCQQCTPSYRLLPEDVSNTVTRIILLNTCVETSMKKACSDVKMTGRPKRTTTKNRSEWWWFVEVMVGFVGGEDSRPDLFHLVRFRPDLVLMMMMLVSGFDGFELSLVEDTLKVAT
ncbi:hypothetical protein M8C21_028492, partial [Ambrosia artemisiifolia]